MYKIKLQRNVKYLKLEMELKKLNEKFAQKSITWKNSICSNY